MKKSPFGTEVNIAPPCYCLFPADFTGPIVLLLHWSLPLHKKKIFFFHSSSESLGHVRRNLPKLHWVSIGLLWDVLVEVLQALLTCVLGLVSVNSEVRPVVAKACNEEILLVLFAVGLVLLLVEPGSALWINE